MQDKIGNLQSLLQRVDTELTSNHPAKWGLMKAQNMVEHLSLILAASTGKWGKEFKGEEAKAAKLKRNFFSVKYPFPKSVPMAGKFSNEVPPLKGETMKDSKAMLSNSLQQFLQHFEANPTDKVSHFYFGMLSFEEWLDFHIKHFEHHLMQFDLIPYPLTEKMEANLALIEEKLITVYSGLMRENQAKWGLMNAHQCVEHLGMVFIYSTGRFGVPFKGDLKAAKQLWEPFVAAANPWKTVFPEFKFLGKPKPTRKPTIEESKRDLKKAYIKFKHYVMENPKAINPHGFLGNITMEQWLQVHPKHIDHHLSQFGVIEELV